MSCFLLYSEKLAKTPCPNNNMTYHIHCEVMSSPTRARKYILDGIKDLYAVQSAVLSRARVRDSVPTPFGHQLQTILVLSFLWVKGHCYQVRSSWETPIVLNHDDVSAKMQDFFKF